MRPIYNVAPRSVRQFKRRRKASWSGVRTFALLATSGLFATAVLVTTWLTGGAAWFPGFDLVYRGLGPSHVQPGTVSESQAGLILFTSPNQDTCRQQFFDNTSGRQRDDGIVDCKSAIYKVKQNQIAARLNALGDGFRQK
jgi:hypothetical protein